MPYRKVTGQSNRFQLKRVAGRTTGSILRDRTINPKVKVITLAGRLLAWYPVFDINCSIL